MNTWTLLTPSTNLQIAQNFPNILLIPREDYSQLLGNIITVWHAWPLTFKTFWLEISWQYFMGLCTLIKDQISCVICFIAVKFKIKINSEKKNRKVFLCFKLLLCSFEFRIKQILTSKWIIRKRSYANFDICQHIIIEVLNGVFGYLWR